MNNDHPFAEATGLCPAGPYVPKLEFRKTLFQGFRVPGNVPFLFKSSDIRHRNKLIDRSGNKSARPLKSCFPLRFLFHKTFDSRLFGCNFPPHFMEGPMRILRLPAHGVSGSRTSHIASTRTAKSISRFRHNFQSILRKNLCSGVYMNVLGMESVKSYKTLYTCAEVMLYYTPESLPWA
jgi:hypothetical protein